MTELQMGMIGLGALAVVGVMAYNKWQERRHRREAERAFKSDHRDVLLEPREEPSAGERREPGIGGADDEPRRFSEAPVKRSAPELPRLLDPRADCVIRLETIEAHTGGLRLAPSFTADLRATVARFDAFAKAGRDEDFGRFLDGSAHGFLRVSRGGVGAGRAGVSRKSRKKRAPGTALGFRAA